MHQLSAFLPQRKGHWLLLIALAVIGGMVLTLSLDVYQGQGYFIHNVIQLCGRTVICSLLFVAFLFIGNGLYYLFSKKATHSKSSSKSPSRWALTFRCKNIVLYTAIMMAFWLPWLIALYPAAMNWDTYYQISQCYPGQYPVWLIPYAPTESYISNTFSDHHPLFDTLLYGSFARVSDFFTGSWNLGVFAFALCQSLILAIVLTSFISYLITKWNMPLLGGMILFIFFTLFPIIPAYAATMIKDSTFLPPFLLLIFCLCEIVRTKGYVLRSKKFLVGFILIGCLCALTNKKGLYILLISLLVLIVAFRAHWRQIAIATIAPTILMVVIMPYVIFPILNVAPGGKQETLGVLFQQTARYVVDYEAEITPDEKQIIDNVLRYDTLADRYNPTWEDSVKFMWNPNASKSDLNAYFLVWLKEGLRHPMTYFQAALAPVSPFFSVGDLEIAWTTGDEQHAGSPLLWQPEELDMFRNALHSAVSAMSEIPVIGLLFKAPFWTLCLPLLAIYLILACRKSLVPIFIPIAGYLVFCFISPTYDTRYIVPLVFSLPLFLGLLFTVQAKNSRDEIAVQH